MEREFIFAKIFAQLLESEIDSGKKSLNVVINGIDCSVISKKIFGKVTAKWMIVVFTNKRSQSKVYKMYFGIGSV